MSKTVAAIFDNYSDAERAAYQIKSKDSEPTIFQ